MWLAILAKTKLVAGLKLAISAFMSSLITIPLQERWVILALDPSPVRRVGDVERKQV